jgi:NADH-quinone oxidoreductase subunit E
MLRRLHKDQPASFAFTPANHAWAEGQIRKYPEGRQASAIIPLLWRAQEQEGWLTRPAIEHVARMLDLAYIRALEVATFYFMFQLQPVGAVAHIQVCGTTTCMICGAEDLIAVCKEKISTSAHTISADGALSWEEVECLGSCSNAPMAQIGKDYYEDLTAARFAEIIDELRAGRVPLPGPQNGRYSCEPLGGATSLLEHVEGRAKYNASVGRAVEMGDTIKRIDGTEVPLLTPWIRPEGAAKDADKAAEPKPAAGKPASPEGITKQEANATSMAKPPSKSDPKADGEAEMAQDAGTRPATLDGPRAGKADDLKLIKGIGPKLEKMCNALGFYHFDQIASWTAQEVAWVDQNLEGFKGRVSRDDWVAQAGTLASGGETEFASRVKKGHV